MADKDIQIRIVTAGGDQAAATISRINASLGVVNDTEQEIAAKRAQFMTAAEAAEKKRAEALKNEVGSLNVLQKELHEATEEYRSATIGSKEFEAASIRVAAAQKRITEANRGVSSSNLNLRSSFQNVGYQVQDLAVQIGSGQGIMRAFGQQAPQLLSGFGPLGVTLGTIAAVALPVASGVASIGESAEDAAPSVDELNDRLEELRKKAAEVAAKKSAKELQEWIDSLDNETVAIEDQNRARERELELVNATRKAKAETEDARREADIAAIEADPNKSDAQKIREVAAISQERARSKAQGELDDLTMARKGAADRVTAEESLATDAQRKLDELTKKREALELEQSQTQGRVDAAKNVDVGIAATQKALKDLASERLAIVGAAGLGKADTSSLDKRRADLVAELARQEAIQKASVEDQVRLKDYFPGLIASAQQDEDQKRKEKEAAEQRAKEAREAADQATAIQAAKAPQIIETFQQRSRGTAQTAEQKAREAQQRDDEEAKREKEREERDSRRDRERGLQDQMESADDRLDDTARSRGLNIRNRGLQSGNDTLSQIGRQLSDGTDSKEIQKIGDLVREKQGELGRYTVQALQKVLDELEQQAAQIQNLKGQIKKSRRDIK